MNEAFTALTPLFSLFADGYYRLEERELYPTDGNGHFFWAVGNEKQPNPATTGQWIADVDYHYQSGEPCFYCQASPHRDLTHNAPSITAISQRATRWPGI